MLCPHVLVTRREKIGDTALVGASRSKSGGPATGGGESIRFDRAVNCSNKGWRVGLGGGEGTQENETEWGSAWDSLEGACRLRRQQR